MIAFYIHICVCLRGILPSMSQRWAIGQNNRRPTTDSNVILPEVCYLDCPINDIIYYNVIFPIGNMITMLSNKAQ